MPTGIFSSALEQHLQLLQKMTALKEDILCASEILVEVFKSSRKVMFCGNGGSAADSQHLAAELTGRFQKERQPLAGLALSTDSSALTCIANDYSYADVFSRQVQALGRPGDCLIGISTSGNSENVIRAIRCANQAGIRTIGLTGHDGGQLKKLCELSIVVPSNNTARIQECHIFVGHVLCEIIDEQFSNAINMPREMHLP